MTSDTLQRCRFVSIAAIVAWVAYTAFCIVLPTHPLVHYSWYVVTITLVTFGFAHGAQRYGWGAMVTLFAFAVVIGNLSEHFSITAGFPFGYYRHTPALGPQLFFVPIFIGPFFFGITYIVWTMTEMILGTSAASRRTDFVIGAPITAALILPGLDMCFDPIGATIGGHWIYRESGGYFGVPLRNYIGWFINGWAIFQTFALILARRSERPGVRAPSYWYEAPAFWGLMGMQYVVLLAVNTETSVVHDSGGWAWRSRDILENAAISACCTMIVAALISALAVKMRTAPGAGQR